MVDLSDIPPVPEKKRPRRDPMYAAQREELSRLLKNCFDRREGISVHEKPALSYDDVVIILQKIKHGLHFSRRERSGLTEAGFLVDKLYPDLL